MPRTLWHEIDAGLRADVERMLGARVVEASSQPGGFSPGSADRVLLEDGRRVFVKTATDAVNPEVVSIHRSEAAVAAIVPVGAPAPQLLGAVDGGDRIALVFEDVDARHPATPWRAGELAAVLDALAQLTAEPVAEDAALADLGEVSGHYAAGWSLLGDRVPPLPDGLDQWTSDEMPALLRAAARMASVSRGDRLVHRDLRADNVLLRADGAVVFVDWPWAARGAGWVDALCLLFNVRYFDPGADVESIVATHPVFAGMVPAAADAVLVGLAGHFLRVSQEPAVPGIPSLRAFQYDQAVALLRWVQERWDRP